MTRDVTRVKENPYNNRLKLFRHTFRYVSPTFLRATLCHLGGGEVVARKNTATGVPGSRARPQVSKSKPPWLRKNVVWRTEKFFLGSAIGLVGSMCGLRKESLRGASVYFFMLLAGTVRIARKLCAQRGLLADGCAMGYS